MNVSRRGRRLSVLLLLVGLCGVLLAGQNCYVSIISVLELVCGFSTSKSLTGGGRVIINYLTISVPSLPGTVLAE